MRPIDADSLIAEFEDYIKSNRACGNNICVTVADVLTETIIDAPTIEQPTWISVEDRLPKCGEIVFCNTQNFFEVLQWDERADVWVGAYRSYWKEYVTHWMPLPQPPKGVE
jgi:hypothetical protein